MIPLMVFTKLKQGFSQTIKDKYSMTDKNFSTVGSSYTPPVFPFVYFNTLPATETGNTFEKGLEGGNFGFQIEVTDNRTQSNARNVMKEISRIMVDMGFDVNGFGNIEDTKNVHRMITRFQRKIGENDSL